MARNEEKAHSVLNRWLELQKEDAGIATKKKKRPYLATLVDNVEEAEKWRRDLLKDVGSKVMQIQNESLDEHKIRELNDEINKLLREKYHWEKRIRDLGGADYSRTSKVIDEDAIIGPGGYIYFGAAKKLPGVQELVRPDARKIDRSRADMYRSIDADYYGYRDDDDGLLVQLEAKAEKEAAEEALEEWKDAQRAKGLDPDMLLRQMGDDVSVAGLPNKKAKLQESFISHVAVPNREDMEKLLVERRKQELMQLLLDAK